MLNGVWWVAENKWMESEEAIQNELLEQLNLPSATFKSTPSSTDIGTTADIEYYDDEVLVDDGDMDELIDKPEPMNDKRLPVTDTKEGRETETPRLEMTELDTKSRTPGNDPKKRVPANVNTGGKKVEDSDEEMTPRSILASKKRKENRRRNHNKSVTFSKEEAENDELFGEFQGMAPLEEDTPTTRTEDLQDFDDSDITEEQVNFYDELFSKYLTMSFRKWKQPLINAYPDGTILATLEDSDLESIIPRRPIRTRIIKEAKKLVKILDEQAAQSRQEHQYGDSFLGAPDDISEDDDDNFQNR